MRAHTVLVPDKYELTALILSGTLDETFALATAEFIAQTMPKFMRVTRYHQRSCMVECAYTVRVNKHPSIETVGTHSVPALRAMGRSEETALKGMPKRHLVKQLTEWTRAWQSLYSLTHVDVRAVGLSEYMQGEPYVFYVRFGRG